MLKKPKVWQSWKKYGCAKLEKHRYGKAGKSTAVRSWKNTDIAKPGRVHGCEVGIKKEPAF